MNTFDYLFDKFGPTTDPATVAPALHMHPSRVRALCASGELPGVKIGGRWIIPTAKLAEILEGGTQNG